MSWKVSVPTWLADQLWFEGMWSCALNVCSESRPALYGHELWTTHTVTRGQTARQQLFVRRYLTCWGHNGNTWTQEQAASCITPPAVVSTRWPPPSDLMQNVHLVADLTHPFAGWFCPASQLCYSQCSSFSRSPRSGACVCIVFYMSNGLFVFREYQRKAQYLPREQGLCRPVAAHGRRRAGTQSLLFFCQLIDKSNYITRWPNFLYFHQMTRRLLGLCGLWAS